METLRPGNWMIGEAKLLDALKRAAAGEDLDLLVLELYSGAIARGPARDQEKK